MWLFLYYKSSMFDESYIMRKINISLNKGDDNFIINKNKTTLNRSQTSTFKHQSFNSCQLWTRPYGLITCDLYILIVNVGKMITYMFDSFYFKHHFKFQIIYISLYIILYNHFISHLNFLNYYINDIFYMFFVEFMCLLYFNCIFIKNIQYKNIYDSICFEKRKITFWFYLYFVSVK